MKISLGYILDGNEVSFRKLFEIYYPPLCLFANHYIKNNNECEDIVQEAFAMLWEKREKIIIRSSIKNYLVSTVRNLCIDHIRSSHSFWKYRNENLNSNQTDADSPDEIYTKAELERMLQKVLEKLPETYRLVFELSRFENMSYDEISRILDISVRSAKRYNKYAEESLVHELKKLQ
ncbi:MAG: RNA polymerase sigma-70 factor [Bacteroidetes bacterium]|uniref:RNA polymerase sigma-70 factor n=1 Tax=Candidatus Cryptobacteroides faecipullorum TaxID=2840764 RepID=A0A9D9I7L7_9BACT|nr:RNA polymerase sigma-70 factor [Candidatus Cryptobacteroides faecipullorum]